MEHQKQLVDEKVKQFLDLINECTDKEKIAMSDYKYCLKYIYKYMTQTQQNKICDTMKTVNKSKNTAIANLQNIQGLTINQIDQALNLNIQLLIESINMIDSINKILSNIKNEIKIKYGIDKDENINYNALCDIFNKDGHIINYRFDKILFNWEKERFINEIRYKYFTILDGTNIANHMFENCKHNEIIGTLLSGKMEDLNLKNHTFQFNDENIEVPESIKEDFLDAKSIMDLKTLALEAENEILTLMQQEKKIEQISILKNRIFGLYEFSGKAAKDFFKQIAKDDYGIEFNDYDIDVHFARQLIYPGQNSYSNTISTSRLEFFTITVLKIDLSLGNYETIEVTCDDIPKLKKLIDTCNIKKDIEYYKNNMKECPEYLRRILLNNNSEILGKEKLSPFEYLLIKNNSSLKEKNKDVSASIPEIYWIFLMKPEMFKEIEINAKFEKFIKTLVPYYYGSYTDSDYTTRIGGLDANIKDFGNGIFGIGFKL